MTLIAPVGTEIYHCTMKFATLGYFLSYCILFSKMDFHQVV